VSLLFNYLCSIHDGGNRVDRSCYLEYVLHIISKHSFQRTIIVSTEVPYVVEELFGLALCVDHFEEGVCFHWDLIQFIPQMFKIIKYLKGVVSQDQRILAKALRVNFHVTLFVKPLFETFDESANASVEEIDFH